MEKRIFAAGAIATGLILGGCADSGSDTGPEPQAEESAASVASFSYPDGSPHPVTEWGDPDLQGMWPIMHLITTPLQRPGNMPEGERMRTAEEIAQAQASMDSRDARYDEMVESNSLGMGGWAESTQTVGAIEVRYLTSYPEDGQVPALTARGEELRPEFGSSWSTEGGDGIFEHHEEDFDTWDRCITRGMPNSMLPFNYNNGIRIVQSPGFVVIDLEMIHESRIVPIDREPLDPAITQWMGEPRGHWEGATLVVETTNYNGKVGMTNVGIPGSPRGDTPSTTNMRTVERFTRVSDDRIEYELTIEDPEVLTDKWVISYPVFLDNEYAFFEYACHEDNTAVRNFIETSRYERQNPEEFAPPPGRGGFGGGGRRGGGPGGRGGPPPQ